MNDDARHWKSRNRWFVHRPRSGFIVTVDLNAARDDTDRLRANMAARICRDEVKYRLSPGIKTNVETSPSSICGIDWSGAEDAGRRIWIARGTRAKEKFVVRRLSRAQELPNSSPSRDRCLDALREWIQSMGPSVLGFDFPFGVPETLMGGQDWHDFVIRFADRFRSAESFADWCRRKARGKELKRTTDKTARTPFSVYNLRMFRQTYWGIAAVLGPLVADDRVSVLPMQRPVPGRPHLLETCPASTLKRLGLYTSYKGKELRHRRERNAIVVALDKAGLATVPSDLTDVIVSDTGGDALDAVIAGVATTAAVTHPDFPRIEWRDEYIVEACVYA